MTLSNCKILITGGTGSFGNAFCQIALQHNPTEIRVFSRGELLQVEMSRKFDDSRLKFIIGDVRDRPRLTESARGVDIIVHAAALKHVPVGEDNPSEAVKTNVVGSMNVVWAATRNQVGKVIGISSDKGVAPYNLYGATKMVMEKLFLQAGFSCVRYGNVAGSRGSVIPLFMKQRETGKLTITHPDMTRFWITLDAGVQFVINSLDRMEGGEIFVPKIPSMRITDLAEAIAPDADWEITGIRAGEKLHEVLISEDEARDTRAWVDHYLISRRWGTNVPTDFSYSSDNNTDWLTVEQLRNMIK